MEPGSWELHIFVSLAVILATAFIALIVDYLKGSNEQLREHNVELRVRREEIQRRAILDPLRYAHPSILAGLHSAVSAKPATTADGAAQTQEAAVRTVVREATATLAPIALEKAEATVAPAAATERPSIGGELLEQVIAATSGGTMGSTGFRIVYQEAALPPVAPMAPPREAELCRGVPPPVIEMEAPDPSIPVGPAEAEPDSADRVVFVTPVEVDEQEDVQSRPLLHQFELIGWNRPLRADVQDQPAAPIRLQLHTNPASESQAGNAWGAILSDSNGTEASATLPVSEPDSDYAPNEWFREPDSHRSSFESYSRNRAPEEPAMVRETEEVNEPIASWQAQPEPIAAIEPTAEEPLRTALLAEVAEEAVPVEDGLMFATPAPESEGPEGSAPDFDAVYSQPVENPQAELVVPLVCSFARASRIVRPELIPWPKPVARPEPVIIAGPAMLPKSRLKPEGTSASSQGAVPATSGAQEQDVRGLGAPRSLEIPAGYHESTLLDDLCREEGLFSGLVIAVGINDFKRLQEATGRPGTDRMMQSVISVVRGCTGNKGFVCRSAEDEFIIIHPNETGPAGQRRLSQVSERLWDFQLRSLGVTSIMFSSGSVEVEHEQLSEAISAANERMHQTKRSRKTVTMHTVRQKRAVNA